MIKLDIINEVVNKTGITKTKAELAVETVFESMKKALAGGERIELRGFGVVNVRPRKNGKGAAVHRLSCWPVFTLCQLVAVPQGDCFNAGNTASFAGIPPV